MTEQETMLSKDEQAFLERVALHLKDQGVTQETFNDEKFMVAAKAILIRDKQLLDILMDKSEASREFREAFGRRVWLGCRELIDAKEAS